MSKKNTIITIIRKTFKLLNKKGQKNFIYILLLTLFNSALDLVGLATVLPIFGIILTDNFLEKYPLLNTIYSNLSFEKQTHFVYCLCAFMLFTICFKNIVGVLINRSQNKFTWDTFQTVSKKVYDSAYYRGFPFFQNTNSNHIVNHIAGVPRLFASSVVQQVIQFLNEVIIIILIVTFLIIYDPMIFLILCVVVIPTFFLFYKITKKKIQAVGEAITHVGPKVSRPVFETIFGYVDVNITGTLQHFKKRFEKGIKELSDLQVSNVTLGLLPSRIIEITVFGTVIIILLYGMHFLPTKEDIIALISIFGLSAYRAIPTINRIMLAIMSIDGNKHSLDIIESYLEHNKQHVEQQTLNFEENIQFQNISFSYQGTPQKALNNISLTIKKGETIGLIGESGSGKTTFANLILRFLIENSGDLLVDNTKLTKHHLDNWKSKIGYVRQDVFLTDASLAENIAFGIDKDKIDYTKLNEVIKNASLESVVENLENGINGVIGERGVKISGGQRQRIGIARALYKNAEILIFDEATSALDSKTEEEITNAIQQLSNSDLTMFIIAHRITTLKYCNKIIEFENGKVKKECKFDDLIGNIS